MNRWWWRLRQVSRKLWVRTSLISSLGVGGAVLAAMVEHRIPWEFSHFVPVDAIESLLTIIATSMLAVSTFSLNIMTGAYGAASSSATPRATRLLMEDTMTQTVLASFVGSFIYSIVGMILLRFGVYGERGRVVLFMVTIAVLAMIVINLLRWINYLTTFGRLGETVGRVEAATEAALAQRVQSPFLGAQSWPQPCTVPEGAQTVQAGCVGHLQHIDMQALSALAQALQRDIYVAALPGKSLFLDTPLAYWLADPEVATAAQADDGGAEAEAAQRIRAAFTVASERSFDQDPRFGLTVLCEIASRALSPATNDPGTALDVLVRCTRLLSAWAQAQTPAQALAEAGQVQHMASVAHPRVHVPCLCSRDLLDDAFMLLARDGAHLVEVQLHLHKSLAALSRMGSPAFRQAACEQAVLALERAIHSLACQADRQRLHQLLLALGHLPASAQPQLQQLARPQPLPA